MPPAHRESVPRDDVAKKLQTFVLSDFLHHHREPVDVLGLDPQAPLPLRMEKVLVGLRQLRLLHQIRVVGVDEHIEARPDPFAVRPDRVGKEIRKMRRKGLLQHFLAVQRLQLGAVRLDDVEVEAAGPRLGDDALHDFFGAGPPELQLHAVLLVEGRRERIEILEHQRRIEVDLALGARALDEALCAIGALVKRQPRDIGGLRAQRPGGGERASHNEREERGVRHFPTQPAASAVSPAAWIPETQASSSSSPVPPLAPAAPRISPFSFLISTPPVCGRNFPCAVAARVMKKLGLSLARLRSARLETPIATEAHALPSATSKRNMLAPSSRCAALTWPASSSTTTAIGLIFMARAFSRAFSMRVLACFRVSFDIFPPCGTQENVRFAAL